MSAKELSPIAVYKLLPGINCKECGEANCMAFAARLVNREANLAQCPPLLDPKNKAVYDKLWALLKPPVRAVEVGVGEGRVTLGGEYVVYRHELTYFNPTAIAIDLTDEMPEAEFAARLQAARGFEYEYIGRRLSLDMLSVRSTSGDPDKFEAAVRRASEAKMPLILCALNPTVMEHGLAAAAGLRPLIYAATRENWREMAELALMYRSPLVASAPLDLVALKSLARTLMAYGVEDLVLDPGTLPLEGVGETLNNFTILRQSAINGGDEALGFPLLGAPMAAWAERSEDPVISEWNEAMLAAALIVRYADLLVVRSISGWALLPLVILRNNIYTDPRKPVSVEPGVRAIGSPAETSPVALTTNFALTYYTVTADLEAAKADCHLVVVDSEGLSVESAIAGRKLTAETVAEALKAFKVGDLVRHRTLILPGRAARISGEVEELTGWRALVGPLDSSGLQKFIEERWKPEAP